MTFEKLAYATRLVSGNTRHNEVVSEWSAKRQQLAAQLADFPTLIEAYRNAHSEPYEKNKNIRIEDPFPRLRLANACEATFNAIYSMAEIASHFANKASGGKLPTSFNRLCRKAELGQLNPALVEALGDLGWYKRVREVRTEWEHFSSIFICGSKEEEPLVSVRAYRRPSDKREIPEQKSFPISELIGWVKKALSTIDAYGVYLLNQYVIPAFDPKQVVTVAKTDENGWPIVFDDGRFDVERITIAEYLRRGGIET